MYLEKQYLLIIVNDEIVVVDTLGFIAKVASAVKFWLL